jgi:hypothetical protein
MTGSGSGRYDASCPGTEGLRSAVARNRLDGRFGLIILIAVAFTVALFVARDFGLILGLHGRSKEHRGAGVVGSDLESVARADGLDDPDQHRAFSVRDRAERRPRFAFGFQRLEVGVLDDCRNFPQQRPIAPIMGRSARSSLGTAGGGVNFEAPATTVV